MTTGIKTLIGVAICAALSGCASNTLRKPVIDGYNEVRRAPMLPITKNVTNFDDSLRCMDGLLGSYGAEASLIVEDLNDKTQKMPAGTTDMFISAMSQMTRRSRAIKTIAFSEDTKNLTNYMLQSGAQQAFQPELVPTYTVRGSISQFDDNLAKKTKDIGVGFGGDTDFIGVGGAGSTSINMVALDLAVVRSMDYSIVPGVNSRNSAAILQQGDGFDGEASYKKFSINFLTSFSKSDGKTVAVRNLVEMSAVELIGKLTKVPYWRCLGASLEQPDVSAEIEDWHESMVGAEKLAFYIRHLKVIGSLPDDDTPIDGPMFKTAFETYVQALGLPFEGSFTLDIMRAHFAAEPDEVMARIEAGTAAVVAQVQAAEPAPAPVAAPPTAVAAKSSVVAASQPRLLVTALRPDGDNTDTVGFQMTAAEDLHIYCFLADETGAVLRVFPNRWQRSARLHAGNAVAVPMRGSFSIQSNEKMQEIRCLGAPKPLESQLPPALVGADLSPISSMANLRAIDTAFAATGETLAKVGLRFAGSGKQLSIDTLGD